jgi:hypothetical protein
MGKKPTFVQDLALPTLAFTFLCCGIAAGQSASDSISSERPLAKLPIALSALGASSGYSSSTPTNHWQPAVPVRDTSFLSRLGVGAKVSTLGVGLEVATPLWYRANVRVGGNFFNYSDNFSQDGFKYNASLHFRSAQASLDWYPFHNGFRVSPGALLYSGNQIAATPTVRGGQTFTLNHTDYVSSAIDPIKGSGKVEFAKAAPMLTVGWGNLRPRGEGHFTFPVEIGFAYVGDPSVVFQLTGSACDAGGVNCRVINSDPSFQSNVQGQQNKIRDDISPLRFYPVAATGVGYRF